MLAEGDDSADKLILDDLILDEILLEDDYRVDQEAGELTTILKAQADLAQLRKTSEGDLARQCLITQTQSHKGQQKYTTIKCVSASAKLNIILLFYPVQSSTRTSPWRWPKVPKKVVQY